MSHTLLHKLVAATLTVGFGVGLATASIGEAQAETRAANKIENRTAQKEVRRATKRPTRKATKLDEKNRSYENVLVRTISTNVRGEIKDLRVRGKGQRHRIAGCGAKLTALPHLMHHYRTKTPVSKLIVRNGCLSGVVTNRH